MSTTGMDKATIVIVGAGQAGGEMATALRTQGFGGSIRLVGDEPHPPYQRPPLSKDYLIEGGDCARLLLKTRTALERAKVELTTGATVVSIDRGTKLAQLSSGECVRYDKLAFATGGRPRRLSAGGLDPALASPNLHYVRTIEDVDRLREGFVKDRRLLIIGAGYIGLEVAAAARKCGLLVTVLEAQDRVLARVAAPTVSSFYQEVHKSEGVDVRLSTLVERVAVDEHNRVTAVSTTGGETFKVDMIVVGIGLLPNTELAQLSGLEVANGIVVDEYCLTSDPDVVAAGDCTNFPLLPSRQRVRLESVPNAFEQARCAAGTLIGKQKPHDAVPWFWSNQYDLKLQMAGLSLGHDDVVIRGNPSERSFLAFYLRRGRLLAMDLVNRAPEFAIAKRLVAQSAMIPREALSDARISLKDLFSTSSASH